MSEIRLDKDLERLAPPSLLNANIRLMLGTLVCGLLGTTGQAGVSVPTLFTAVAREMGFTLGISMIANKADHLRIREAMRRAFREGMDAAPKIEPPNPLSRPATAVPLEVAPTSIAENE